MTAVNSVYENLDDPRRFSAVFVVEPRYYKNISCALQEVDALHYLLRLDSQR